MIILCMYDANQLMVSGTHVLGQVGRGQANIVTHICGASTDFPPNARRLQEMRVQEKRISRLINPFSSALSYDVRKMENPVTP